MKTGVWLTLAAVTFLLMLANPCINLGVCSSLETQVDEKNENIEDARAKLQEAFNSTVEAERAGAKVGEAVNRLNNALDYVSQAENRSAEGDMEQVFALTQDSIQLSEETLALAQDLKQQAESLSYVRLIICIVIAVAVLILGIFAFFLGRRIWKRHQQNKFMEMRVKGTPGSK